MEFGLLDSGEDGKHSGAGAVEIFQIYAIQDKLYLESGSYWPKNNNIIYGARTCWKSING